MTFTTKILAGYLGNSASTLLSQMPFKSWTVEKSFETDLEKLRIDYVFPQNGCDFVCDAENVVQSIFLYFDQSRCFKEGVQDLPFNSSRQEVIAQLGSPSKSGGRVSDPILGEYGAWDRFLCSDYAIHVEYGLDADVINKVTLMRADSVPL